MPITWYVAPVAADSLEVYGVSAALGLGKFCGAVSIGGELFVADSSVEISAAVGLDKRCEAVSTGGELVVADSAVGVSVAAGLIELCNAISIAGELLVADSAVAGVGDAATDEVFGWCVMARIIKASATPVNSAIVPKENCFAREAGRACVGSGGGTVADRGGAPQKGQAVANELISLPHS
jgi:hypothetical protein